jgi:Fe-S-cluster containining protein
MKKNPKLLTAHIELSVDGKPRIMELNYPAKPVKLRRMLPVFQKASNYFVKLSVEKSRSKDKEVSCQAGCAACCRQPVPVSESEAHLLRNVIEAMPETDKTRVKKRFDDAFDHLEKTGWFKRVIETSRIKDKKTRSEKHNELAREYYAKSISCPFLKNESCSIYNDRPLICREYLVTSPPENCENPFENRDKLEPVENGIKASQALFKMAIHKSDGQDSNFVPLIALLRWADGFSENEELKTGEKWVREFFSLLAGKKDSE